jgi:translation initiation factor 5B
MLRTPIVCVVGHIDHGKTTLLDYIRGSIVAKKEAGGITQHIGATEVPLSTIYELVGSLAREKSIFLPGLLFIDTPGHHSFTSLRARGSSVADLAVLVVDIMEGCQKQTWETLRLLRRYRTPFVIAANKIDRLDAWSPFPGLPFYQSYEKQGERVRQSLDEKIYELVGSLSGEGFSCERYDRVRDFRRNVCIVPLSAKTGEGIPDLLLVLLGLAQRFLSSELKVEEERPGRGTVLEVREEKGLGTTIDAILWDGELCQGDPIILATHSEPIVTKIRALLKPLPLTDIRRGENYSSVDRVVAAAGVKIAAPQLEEAAPGLPFLGGKKMEVEDAVERLRSEIQELKIKTDKEGIVVKADTLGSLEAIVAELRNNDAKIQKAEVGAISKRDVIDASTGKKCIAGFGVRMLPDASEEARNLGVDVLLDDVIYRLIDEYKLWMKKMERIEMEKLEKLAHPAKFKILPEYIFRSSKPAILGIRVLAGSIKPGVEVMRRDGKVIGRIKGIQSKGESLASAGTGEEVAVSIDGPTYGRQIKGDETLWISLGEKDISLLLQAELSPDEAEVLDEIIKIRRKK